MEIDLCVTKALSPAASSGRRTGNVPKFSVGEVALRDQAFQLSIQYPVVKRDRDAKE